MKLQLLTLLLLLTTTISAQYSNFNTQRNWSLNKKEIGFGFGATQFLGDLGGRNRIGTDFSLVDLDLAATSIMGTVGYRYRWHPYWATSCRFSVGQLKGSDKNTNELIRSSRNLSFKSLIIDYQQRIEMIIIANEKVGKRYSIPGLKGMKNKNSQVYLFTGVGMTYFNPKGDYNGSWVALKPLQTEGNGMADGAKKYSGVTATIPFGIGVRRGMGKMWRVGIEATYVKTFTDFIDDVSTKYYDPNLLSSPEAKYFSNPANKNTGWFAPGQQRGDKNLDAYFQLNVFISKNITYKNYSKLQRWGKWRKGYRSKF
jgi:hypothetical protein